MAASTESRSSEKTFAKINLFRFWGPYIFWLKRVIFTPAKTTRAASQL